MLDDRVKRIHTLKNILIIDEEKSYPATITDFSIKGISVITEHILPTYKMIELHLKIEDTTIILKGNVRWIHENKKESKPRFNELGIGLISPPDEYLEYIKSIEI